ncbi:uncharacterized protein CLAFUR5_07832 [Fulvia fulva]|uniref:ThiD2 domain-containing protein n=1 Tax=Passalora fulva TaxID=5499 RepID=A0A9Q8LD28_PASFU|nr:uncharacterized protein CLAFUR5_07832 [Fulvia fulva]UJO15177.1 hypothetical protein CLAFUR5_07832 [Fulvia fulva]
MPPKGATKASPAKKSASSDRPSSPTSLLWAHQIKREHACLLQKMNTLEASIKTVERNAKNKDSDEEIAAIAEQLRTLADGGDLHRVRKEVMKNIEDLQAGLESVLLQVDGLTRENESRVDARKKQFDAEKEVLKRVKEVEKGLAESQSLLQELGERVSEEKMNVIKADLAEIIERVQGDGVEMERVGESLRVLEDVARVLKEDNRKVAAEVKEMREREAVVPSNDVQEDPIADGALTGDIKTKSQKKAPVKKKVKEETAAASKPIETAASQRPRRGGGLQRELAELQQSQVPQVDRIARNKAAGATQPALRRGGGPAKVQESDEEPSTSTLAAASPSRTREAAVTTKRGRRAANVVTPTVEEVPKRGRGRLRKDISQTIEKTTVDPPKRRTGCPRKDTTQAAQAPPVPAPKSRIIVKDDDDDDELTQSPAPTRKRKANALLDDSISPPPLRRGIKLAPAGAKKKPQLRRSQMKVEDSPSPKKRVEVKKGGRRGLTTMWDGRDGMTPISSSMSEGEAQEAFGPAPVQQEVGNKAVPTSVPSATAAPATVLPATGYFAPVLPPKVPSATARSAAVFPGTGPAPLPQVRAPQPRKRREIPQEFSDDERLRKLSRGEIE